MDAVSLREGPRSRRGSKHDLGHFRSVGARTLHFRRLEAGMLHRLGRLEARTLHRSLDLDHAGDDDGEARKAEADRDLDDHREFDAAAAEGGVEEAVDHRDEEHDDHRLSREGCNPSASRGEAVAAAAAAAAMAVAASEGWVSEALPRLTSKTLSVAGESLINVLRSSWQPCSWKLDDI